MSAPRTARRFDGIELSLIRQINALARPDSLNLGIGEPNIEPDEELLQMAAEATRGSWHYSANPGLLSTRRAIADGLRLDLDPAAQICLTAGTQEGLYALMQAFVDDGDEVLTPDPGFLAYATIAKLAGGTVTTYALDAESWQPILDSLRAAISSKTKLIIVNSPSNPTGGVIPRETLLEIAEIAREANALVISDEVYRELYYGVRPTSMRGMGEHVLVLSGMSKSHAMTGQRLGWILGAPELLPTIVKSHQYIATCASVFAQRLTELIFTRSEWNERWLQRVRSQFAQQQAVALRACAEHLQPVAIPGGAFYLFVPVPLCGTVDLAKRLATEAGVLAIPGVAFGERGEGFLRLSYAAEPAVIEEGIKRIGRYLNEWRVDL